ncbi:MAG: hypothetical protein HN366_01975 [Deltaproteobacteria bacterium]|jgi:hypothetical protein|nr:hypothetical protein [Deltaproteobacteria bacterium]MBT7715371.1 hypothetical protein [Deltaproteobacteria bacterium]
MEKWKTIEPGAWKPEKEGANIIGVLVNKEAKDEQSGLSARYYLENEEGTFFVWGCAIIDDRMQYAKIGQKVRITFEGKTKNKRNQTVNLYKVEVSETQAEKTEPNKTIIDDEPVPESIEEIDEVM